MKYKMENKTDIPKFNFLVMHNDERDYYLYKNFDDALRKIIMLSKKYHGAALLYEPYLNNTTREYFVQNTFTAYDGIPQCTALTNLIIY